MSHPNVAKNDWDGASSIFTDSEERRVLFAALDSFRSVSNILFISLAFPMLRSPQSVMAMIEHLFLDVEPGRIVTTPDSAQIQWQLLSAPPFNFLKTLERVDDAIDANADIAAEILETGLESFGLQNGPPGLNPINWHGEAKSSDLDKARSTIRQFYRDWSSEGATERRASYGPVLRDIH
ncbi:MAG: hypothetical protein Q9192_006474, partial [Flavoplaca navasiana]